MTDKALFAAMAKAFQKFTGALKDSTNPHFKSKYADLSSVDAAVRPALSENGLFYGQVTHEHDGGVCVETIIFHESGEQLSFGKLFVPASKSDAQGYGSALTYARRYSLMTAFGVCPEDDDGNAASARPLQETKPSPMPDAEFAKLEGLRSASGVTTGALLKKYKIKDLRHLTQDQYSDCIEGLQGVIAKKAKEQSDQQAAQHSDDLNDDIPY